MAAALFALLAFAPIASASPDPVESGYTKLALNKNWFKYLKTFGIKVQKVKPSKQKGKKQFTFSATEGSMDPTNGLGTDVSSPAASSSRPARSPSWSRHWSSTRAPRS